MFIHDMSFWFLMRILVIVLVLDQRMTSCFSAMMKDTTTTTTTTATTTAAAPIKMMSNADPLTVTTAITAPAQVPLPEKQGVMPAEPETGSNLSQMSKKMNTSQQRRHHQQQSSLPTTTSSSSTGSAPAAAPQPLQETDVPPETYANVHSPTESSSMTNTSQDNDLTINLNLDDNNNLDNNIQAVQVQQRNMKGKMKQISTGFSGTKAQYGAMFDVRSLPNTAIRIDTLSFHTIAPQDQCKIQVFTKEGSHEYFEEESSAWKRIVSTSTECLGPTKKTTIYFRAGSIYDLDDVRIKKGQRRAFYIRAINTQIIYSVTQLHNKVFIQDENIQIFTGVAVGSYFKDFWAPRMLNIDASYIVEDLGNGSVGLGNSSFGRPINDDLCKNTLNIDTKDGVNKNFGLMFNIKSNSDHDIRIYGLGFYVDSTSNIDYDIYRLKDGFEYGSASTTLWDLSGQGVIKDADQGSLVMISGKDFKQLTLKPGEMYGYYITLHTENLRYHSTLTKMGDPYVQNKDLSVMVGAGVSGYPLDGYTEFLSRRAFQGNIFYGIDKECKPEIVIKYTFLVKYPSDWSIDKMRNDINFTVEKTVTMLIESDEELKGLSRTFNLQLSSVFTQHDAETSDLCTATQSSLSCDTVETNVALSYDGDVDEKARRLSFNDNDLDHTRELQESIDESQVTFKMLQHSGAVVDNLNSGGSLIVVYTGEESLDYYLIIAIAGVPQIEMSRTEVGYFQSVTKGFLKQRESGSLEILSVQVQKQTVLSRRNLADTDDIGNDGIIDIETKVTGKHRPPSPGLNFDELVEDSINAEDGSFKDELKDGIMSQSESGAQYFNAIKDVYTKPLVVVPTKPPTLQFAIDDNPVGSGISGPISIVIVICAALLTFGLVFGAFVLRKRQRDKKRLRKSIFDDEEEDDPLFFDSFDTKKSSNNITLIPPFARNKKQSIKSFSSGQTEAITEDSRDGDDIYGVPAPFVRRSSSRFGSRQSLNRMESQRSGVDRNRPLARKGRMTKHVSEALMRDGNHDVNNRQNSLPLGTGFDYDERIREKEGRMMSSRDLDNGMMPRRDLGNVMMSSRDLDNVMMSTRDLDNGMMSRRDLGNGMSSRRDLGDGMTSRRNLGHGMASRREIGNGMVSRREIGNDDYEQRIRFDEEVHVRPTRDVAHDYEERIRSKTEPNADFRRNNSLPREIVNERSNSFSRDDMDRDNEERMRVEERLNALSSREVANHYEDRMRAKEERSNSFSRDIGNGYDDMVVIEDQDRPRDPRGGPHVREESMRSKDELEERIRLKYEGSNPKLNASTRDTIDRHFSKGSEGLNSQEGWDTRQQNQQNQQPNTDEDRSFLPAHLRFQRRPSEDGEGISIASASTSSSISSVKFNQPIPPN